MNLEKNINALLTKSVFAKIIQNKRKQKNIQVAKNEKLEMQLLLISIINRYRNKESFNGVSHISDNLEICHMANKKADMAMLLDDVNQIQILVKYLYMSFIMIT